MRCRLSNHWISILQLILAAMLGAGCSTGTTIDTAPNATGKRILRVAYNREIDVLNAYTSQNLVDIEFSMVEGLITTDENNTYIPVLAKQIPTEDNGLIVRQPDGTIEMTWQLQENVRWHDGRPLTGNDVCFTWRFVSSEDSETYNREKYMGILDCRTPDPNTVIFRWDGEYGFYSGIFEAILPEHILGHLDTAGIVTYEPYNRGSQTIGTGPFKFAEWKSGEYIRVVRNEDYWRGPDFPKIDEIVWSFIPDSNTRLNALKAGRYDYGQIEPTQVAEVSALADYKVHLIDRNALLHFDLNLKTPRGQRLFGDPGVRKALFQAIDREAIANQLMQGTVRVAHTPINPSSPFHNPQTPQLPHDPGASQTMLDRAGWPRGADGIRHRDGEPLSFTLLNRAGRADHIAIAQVIQAQLKTIGVEVKFETLESAAWTQRWRSSQWEAIVSTWFLPADPSITGLYACQGANNMAGVCDPEFDQLLEASDRALAFEARKPLLDQAQVRLAELAFSLPIYYNVTPEVVHRRIRNFKGSGTNFGSFWNLYEWRLED